MTFAAPDQTAEWEKLTENGDAKDMSVAAERSDQLAELEEQDENGHVQRVNCRRIYFVCLYRYGVVAKKLAFTIITYASG